MHYLRIGVKHSALALHLHFVVFAFSFYSCAWASLHWLYCLVYSSTWVVGERLFV